MLACFIRFRPGIILIFLGRRARGCRTGMALCTAGFAQCVCQGFTNCRFDDCDLMTALLSELFDILSMPWQICFLCMSLALLPGTYWMSHAIKATLTHDHH